jgi:1-acyl-sn-glycerol-3-phosphate acyltransferase
MKKQKNPLLYLISLLQFLYCIYALLVFAILTILSVITMLFLLPFSKSKLSKRVYKICRYWSKAFLLLIGIQHIEIFEDNHDFKKPHIFVANHNSYMDIPPIVESLNLLKFPFLVGYTGQL